ncbi:MAG: ribonuclease III [Peptococcaceae bacterium]|nr:ribonuclease III [Peptococcaceae bacterium]MBO5114889.1 ribonuclease III [Peptococcaceae bacterium]MBO5141317.1 ribonuclease III [Peptococcaceae bacterium]MBO5301539.1 ribonuclease III [Peptococcaceae bacterium]MBO5365268.1 ribonuclease III [Peptococcaceae bacterium]
MIPQKREEHLKKLTHTLNIQLDDMESLSVALTHPSFILGDNASLINNQRLEFLGDAVVDLVVGQYLYNEFPDKPEGELTKMRAALVCESALASAARRVSLGEYLLIGKGERGSGGYDRPSNLADAWEAMVGAIYLQLGIDAVRPIILEYIGPEIAQVRKGHYGDYKTILQEIVQQDREATIQYEIVRTEGPDHDKKFTACVRVNGVVQAEGTGRTKKEAEQIAACQTLIQMGAIEQ